VQETRIALVVKSLGKLTGNLLLDGLKSGAVLENNPIISRETASYSHGNDRFSRSDTKLAKRLAVVFRKCQVLVTAF
jgi:hypothetical protein